MNEFSLIEKYFNWAPTDLSVKLGVGDDCAICELQPNTELLSSVDTLIEGVHFPFKTSAKNIAHKALAANLSDLAAMGARPRYFTLALTLPTVDEQWLADFSRTLAQLSAQFNLSLIGGDTTKGTLSISINVLGQISKGKALLRSSAEVGDWIFVSNTIGDAAFSWWQMQNNQTPDKHCLRQFNTPTPQIKLGQKLVGIANACIDISDGLTQDLAHILQRSAVGADIDVAKIPLSNAVAKHIQRTGDWCLALAGGDDYQLCFTVPANKIKQLEALDFKLTRIGTISKNKNLVVQGFDKTCKSYRHF